MHLESNTSAPTFTTLSALPIDPEPYGFAEAEASARAAAERLRRLDARDQALLDHRGIPVSRSVIIAVWRTLLSFAGSTGVFYGARQALADESFLDVRTVQRALTAIVALGWAAKHEDRTRRVPLYILQLRAATEAPCTAGAPLPMAKVPEHEADRIAVRMSLLVAEYRRQRLAKHRVGHVDPTKPETLAPLVAIIERLEARGVPAEVAAEGAMRGFFRATGRSDRGLEQAFHPLPWVKWYIADCEAGAKSAAARWLHDHRDPAPSPPPSERPQHHPNFGGAAGLLDAIGNGAEAA